MSKKITEEQKKYKKQKRIAKRYEKKYGNIIRTAEKKIKEILDKNDLVILSEVYDENFRPVMGRFEIRTQFIPLKIAKKISEDRLKHINDQAKLNLSKITEKKA